MGNCCSSCRPRKEADLNLDKDSHSGRIPTHQPAEDSSPASKEGLKDVETSTAVPSTRQYYMKTGKKTVQLLQTAAQFAPVPFVKEALDVVLKLIEVCEEVTALQAQLEDLKDRLGSLGLIIYDLVEGEEGQNSTVEPGIAKLRDDLAKITKKLQDIQSQSKMVLVFHADLNKEAIEDCLKEISFALDNFHVSHAINTEKNLQNVLRRLEKMAPGLEIVSEDVKEILGVVKTMENDVNQMREDMEVLIRNKQAPSAATFFASGMPARLANFRGRHEMVKTIEDCLCSNDPTRTRVAVLATGGMGKTALAVEVMESDIVQNQFDFAHRFWVSCKEATSFAIFMKVLATSLRVKTDLGDLRRDIHVELAVPDDPRLIILDNFETPWGTSEQSAVESVLCDLAKFPHVAILITMRSNLPPSNNIVWHVERLQPVDATASRQIYTDIDRSAVGHEALDELLTALGHMPYAIKLIATLGKESESQPDILLRIWKKKGTGILGDKNEMDRSISLSVESNLMQSHPEALSLLITLSMLPAGATSDHLDWWAPSLEDRKLSAIAILNRAALISKAGEQSSPTWFVYPVVQRYMEHTSMPHRISAQNHVDLQQAAFKFILDHKSSPGNPTFKDDRKALASEDVNLQGILTLAAAQRIARNNDGLDEIWDTKLLDSLLAFSHYQLWSKPVLDVVQPAVNLARHLGRKSYLAEALNCLGQVRRHLDDDTGAIAAMKEARGLFTSLSDPLRAAQTTCLLMYFYVYLDPQTTQSERDALEKEVHVELETLGAAGDPRLRAVLLGAIGCNQWWDHHFEESLKYLSRAQDAFGPLGYSFEAAQCLNLVGRCCIGLEDYSKARDAFKLAVEGFGSLGLDSLANIAMKLEGYCLMKLQEYDEALQILQRCLPESRRLGIVLGIAQDLELIAQAFEWKGDFALVALGYTSALEQYNLITHTPAGRDGKERCEYNLSVLANEEGDAASEDQDSLTSYLWHLEF